MGAKATRLQYTIRNIPPEVDRELRRRAARRHQSLNQVILGALSQATVGGVQHADFTDLVGQWRADPRLDRALAAQRQVDEELWK